MEGQRSSDPFSTALDALLRLGARGAQVIGAAVEAAVDAATARAPEPEQGTDENGLPVGFITWQFVKARPEGMLIYPGATRLRGISWNTDQAGSPGAAYGGVYVTEATPAEIYAWYGRWLESHGWDLYRDRPKGGATVWLSDKDYRRHGREIFGVAIDNPQVLGRVLGASVPAGGTIFEYWYEIFPPGMAAPGG